MPENVPFDESSPFFVPSPTTTASDLLRIVEEIQEKKRRLDSQLLAVLPNIIASHAIKGCEARASVEGRSLNIEMDSASVSQKLPPSMMASFSKDDGVLDSCYRILRPLGAEVLGIIAHLGFKCAWTMTANNKLSIEISW